MKSKFSFIDQEISRIKKTHLYRQLRQVKVSGAVITINKKNLINLCSNDYLGIPPGKIKERQLQSSSRLVSGNDISFLKLEKKLAKHKNQRSSLIFPTGYMANLGLVSCLVQKNDVILSDELNHSSIIESCKLSGAKTIIYKHNDMEDLEKKLQSKNKRKFIITEGIFSMDGDFPRLKEISSLAKRYGAYTILDDAHGDFVVGRDGKGTTNHFGVKVDAYTSSLSKGLGSFGGYVASEESVIELCINKSRSFIYTSALPSTLIEYSLSRFNSNREKYRKRLEKNVKDFSNGLKSLGYNTNSCSQIIPIIIGPEKTALEFGDYLFKNGIFAQPIRYPTVPKNSARLRFSITAWLTKNQLEKTLSVLDTAGKKFGIV